MIMPALDSPRPCCAASLRELGEAEAACQGSSRLVRKQVYAWNTGTSDWNATASVDERYVYDGWNP